MDQVSETERPDDAATAKLAMGLHVLLQAGSRTVATAESLTGGMLAAILTDAPGASGSYVGGVVAYATELKVGLLGVPTAVVEEHGVVSAECAAAMARGVRALTGADYALSTTGVAGPAPQEDKSAGTVFVGIAGPGGVRTERLGLEGNRHGIREGTCAAALSVLADMLESDRWAAAAGEETPLG